MYQNVDMYTIRTTKQIRMYFHIVLSNIIYNIHKCALEIINYEMKLLITIGILFNHFEKYY